MKETFGHLNGFSPLILLSLLIISSASRLAGQVFVWPSTTYGQIYGQTNVPAMTTNAVALTGGDFHCLALLADGRVQSWGSGGMQTNTPPDATNMVSVAAGSSHSLAARADGAVRFWGSILGSSVTSVPAQATNAVTVAAGSGAQHALALRADGSVVEWGAVGTSGALLSNIPPAASSIVQVAAGSQHSVALRSDGKVVAWGDNSNGQTNVPTSATNIVAIAAGWRHNLALRANGTVLAWGTFFGGSPIPQTPASVTNIIEIACGGNHLMALRRDGQLIVWGQTFTLPATATNLATIGGGSYVSMAAAAEGPPVFQGQAITRRVASGATAYLRLFAVGARRLDYQWSFSGTNLLGATNSVLVLSNMVPNQSGAYTLTVSNALGTATNSEMVEVMPVIITAQPQSQAVFSGATNTFIVTAVGQGPLFYYWQFNGTNIVGATNSSLTLTNIQLADACTYSVIVSNTYGTATSTDVVLTVAPILITARPQDQVVFLGGRATFSIAAQSSQPIKYQWQFNNTDLVGAANAVLTITNVAYSQAGNYAVILSNALASFTNAATMAVVPVAAWGLNSSSQLNTPADLTNVIALAAGDIDSLALKTDGTVVVWGANPADFRRQVPSDLTNAAAISAGRGHVLALRADGRVTAWGYNNQDQTNVPSEVTSALAVAAGGFHSLALKPDRTVIAWGQNDSGQTNVPPGLSNVVAIAGGSYHSLALRDDGTAVAWGNNSSGQTNVPTALSNVVAIAAGYVHSLALKADGTVAVWGSTSYGLPNIPAGATNVVAISAGFGHCLALKADGTIVAWGYSSDGETALPYGLANVTVIAAGLHHSLALVDDGTSPPHVRLVTPMWNDGQFSISLPTRSGRVYALEYRNSLGGGEWIALPLVAGNGGVRTLTDPTANGTQRFYRVRQW